MQSTVRSKVGDLSLRVSLLHVLFLLRWVTTESVKMTHELTVCPLYTYAVCLSAAFEFVDS